MGTGQPTQPSNLLFNRLVFALTHPDEFVRAGAAVALGKLQVTDAVEHLAGGKAVCAKEHSGHAKSLRPSVGQARLSESR